MRKAGLIAWAVVALLLGAGIGHAEKRVALVVGNSAYQHADRLDNPLTDARRMRDKLAKLGFDVVFGENVGKQALERAIGDFANAAQDADVALVYFAGHGATFGDTPYVVPIDARFSSLAAVPYELVPVETLIGELRRAKGLRIAILDACRDNASERELKRTATRGGQATRGLARVKNAEGLILAYATQYMATAADGPASGDSPFTGALLEHIDTPGLDVKELFFRVGRDVIASTNGAQRPEISVSLYDSYALVPGTQPDRAPLDPAAQAWAMIKDTTSREVLDAFVQRFGDSFYGDLARARLERLKKDQSRLVAPKDEPAVVAQRVVLYEEDPADKDGKRYVGSVVWRTETVAAGAGRDDTVVRGDIELPDRKLKLKWTLQRNVDKTLPASHIVEIVFTLAPGFVHGGVQNVPGVLMKDSQETRGLAIAGLTVKVTDGYFLVGLSAVEAEMQRNIALLKDRPWFDIPIVYDDGRRAILAVEKGSSGDLAFKRAFAAWEQKGSASR